MYLTKIISYAFINIFFAACKLQMRIMHTSIFNFLPQLKQHHLVLLSKNDDVYSIDFTPVDDRTRSKTLLKLLFGRDVKGEIRLRFIENSTLWEEERILTTIWDKPLTEIESRELSNSIYNSIKDCQIKDIIDKLLSWKSDKNQTMNLYVRNCQHFSGYAKKLVSTDLYLEK